MSSIPRVSVGTVQAGADATPLVGGLLELLKLAGRQVQIFRDRAAFCPTGSGRFGCEVPVRYLDSWLMSPALCRESFSHGAHSCDLALIAGRFDAALAPEERHGSRLEDLSQWLDSPQLAVVDVAQLSDCRLPARPPGVAGLLLDRVNDDNLHYWQTLLESLWGVPVLGSLPELPQLRAEFGARTGQPDASTDICRALAVHLACHCRVGRLMELAAQHEFVRPAPKLFQPGDKLAGLTVAVAYDKALGCYFPDVLDLLELQGASVQDFSPLHDESLPAGADVVYIGSGHPERYAAQLAANTCMSLALRNHVCQGRRIFAEVGGLAYLCQQMLTESGEVFPMAGVFPALAIHQPHSGPSQPTELILNRDHWLGPDGGHLRGYLNPTWHVQPFGQVENYTVQAGLNLIARRQAVGSRLHINFAAQPEFLRCFSSSAAHTLV